jgi:hypothetical protein
VNTGTSIADVISFARSRSACSEALAWLKTQDSPRAAWQTCERPDWMIWLAARRGVDRKVLVRIACDCARTALRFVPEGEERPRLAIETTERWLVSEATTEQVRAAGQAADAAAAYAADAYAYAAYAAYAAAYAAYAAADAAAYAADAAAYAAYAAAYAADAYARREANIKMCEIVRKHIEFADLGFEQTVVYALVAATPIFEATCALCEESKPESAFELGHAALICNDCRRFLTPGHPAPDPNDTPPPDGPGAPPNITSDGVLPAATPAATIEARTSDYSDGPDTSTVNGREEAAPMSGYFLACQVCGGPHRATQCPEVAAEKARQARQLAFGRALWSSYCERRETLRAILKDSEPARRQEMASAAAAFLSERWGRAVPAGAVLNNFEWLIKNAAPA